MKKRLLSIALSIMIAVTFMPVTANAAFALTAVTGLKATAQTSSVKLTWEKVSGAKKYQVYRATSDDGKYSKLGTTGKTYYTNSSLAKGKKYFYKVRAYRYVDGKLEKGKFCASVQGASKPATPKNVTATCSDGTVTVKWDKVSYADSYVVYRSEKKYKNFKKAGTAESTEYVEQDTLTDGETYYYKIRAAIALGESTVKGSYSVGQDREEVVAQAEEWLGAVECSKKQKKIINIYNNYKYRKGAAIGCTTPWCAAFVSAVFITAGVGDLIRCDCYCPSVLNAFSKKEGRNYAPEGGDVIFYDWNYNNCPDHVGLIAGYNSSKKQVTAIEGNTTVGGKYEKDRVALRTFTKGWSLVLKYGIPEYSDGSKVKYAAGKNTGTLKTAGCCENMVVEDPVDSQEVAELQEAIQEEPASDEEGTVENIVEYIQEEMPAAEESCNESVYDAFLLMNACECNGIDASVVTLVDEAGNAEAYNEVVIDGTLLKVDASEEGELTEITPEEIN